MDKLIIISKLTLLIYALIYKYNVHIIETHARAEGVRRIHRNLDVLLECMQSSLKVGVSEILMPNVSHPAFWSGPYQNSSVFPGCLGLDLIFSGTCFVYGAMLTAEKPHLECGLDVYHTLEAGQYACPCVLVTPQAI